MKTFPKAKVGLVTILVSFAALTASAADQWFVLGEKVLNSTDSRTEIKSEEVVKSGGQTAEKDAPGREATLSSVAIHYKILNNQPKATIKVWGFD
jgi:hypothetical protein